MFLLAAIFKKYKVSKIQILALTFCLVFLFDPLFIHKLSFILSFSITAGIVLIAPTLKDKNKLLQLFAISLTATLITIPITAYFFYYINYNSLLI